MIFQQNKSQYLRTNLITALASLEMYNFTHFQLICLKKTRENFFTLNLIKRFLEIECRALRVISISQVKILFYSLFSQTTNKLKLVFTLNQHRAMNGDEKKFLESLQNKYTIIPFAPLFAAKIFLYRLSLSSARENSIRK